jgi:hypothetical protein
LVLVGDDAVAPVLFHLLGMEHTLQFLFVFVVVFRNGVGYELRDDCPEKAKTDCIQVVGFDCSLHW